MKFGKYHLKVEKVCQSIAAIRLKPFKVGRNTALLGRELINAKPQPYRCELDEGQVREFVVARSVFCSG
jgi:hypothetical protein